MRFKNIRIYFYIALGLGLAVRFFQYFYTMDFVTGFFKPDYKSIGIILVAVVFAISLSMAAVCFLVRRCPIKLPHVGHTAGSFALLNAIAILIDIATLHNGVNVPVWQGMLLKITGALAAVFFGAIFVKCLKNYKIPSLCFAAPVLYYLTKLIYSFTASSVLALISDHIYTLVAEIFTVLFMLEFALLANNLGGELGYKKIAATGFTAVILSAISSLPPIVTYLANRSLAVRVDFSSEFVMLTTACFIYCFLRRHFSGRNLKRRHKHIKHRSHLSDDKKSDNFYMG
ncbi:MAG: hypothetical protein E7561_04230 [Ruminococcaceae bacterium]|nr:hypothetical protein [Oscillospiraceae bacterium]